MIGHELACSCTRQPHSKRIIVTPPFAIAKDGPPILSCWRTKRPLALGILATGTREFQPAAHTDTFRQQKAGPWLKLSL